MNPLHNLPANQRDLQRRVDQWNADEALWRSLEPKRRLRRAMRHGLTMTCQSAIGKEATAGGVTKAKRK